MNKIIMLVMMLTIAGCASVASVNRPVDYYQPGDSNPNETQLFSSSNSNLSEKEIERILNYRLKLPTQNRIAILKLSESSYWRFYSNDFAELTDSIAKDFIGELRSSSRVYDASFLPAMLIPEKRTVPFLREASARFQADLLLAYRTNCHTYEKYRIIDPNETKAYCSVEAVLLDIRSGIVPFTMVSTNEFSAKKVEEEKNFSETIKKAELSAISKSLHEIAIKLKEFLNSAERI